MGLGKNQDTEAKMDEAKTPLRRIRRGRGLSLDEVHRGTGINPARLSRYERGYMWPSERTQARLAEYFDIPACVLFPPPEGQEKRS